MSWSPSRKDIDFYRENGFLIARDVFDEKQPFYAIKLMFLMTSINFMQVFNTF